MAKDKVKVVSQLTIDAIWHFWYDHDGKKIKSTVCGLCMQMIWA